MTTDSPLALVAPYTEYPDPAKVAQFLLGRRVKMTFDVGSNIGQAAKLLRTVSDRVISFEPVPESVERARQVDDPKGVVCQCAVSDHDGTATLYIASRSRLSGQLVSFEGLHWGDIEGSLDVPCFTLDTLSGIFGPPDLVKIDVEGHELLVLAGAKETIAEYRPWMCVEVHVDRHEAPVREMLEGYELTKVEHEHLAVNSPLRNNHFWILGGPSNG